MQAADRRGLRWWHAVVAGLAYAALMFAAFPPISLWGASFFAALPLAFLGWHCPRPFRYALLAMLGVTPFFVYHLAYVSTISVAGVVPLILYISAWPALFVWCLGVIRRRFPRIPATVLVPIVWVGLDTLRGEVIFGGYEWFMLGQPLIGSVLFAGAATIGGGYLVSLLVAIPASALIDLGSSNRSQKKPAYAIVSVSILVWITGAIVIHTDPQDETIAVALVQTNVPQDNKIGWTYEQRLSDFQDFVDLTQQTKNLVLQPDLIVWPETMFPGFALDKSAADFASAEGFEHLNQFRLDMLTLQESVGVPMLVGATTAQGLAIEEVSGGIRFTQNAIFNSAYIIDNGTVMPERYDKIAPTPFGETLPYIKSWPWLQNLVLRIGIGANGMDFGLDAGTDPSPLTVETNAGTVRIATPICFESSQSRICRRIANAGEGADLMVVITNDGWYSRADQGREMHLMMARWRCVELGLSQARCANTGISAIIDAKGRVTARLRPRESKVLSALVHVGSRQTLYRFVGNSAGWATLVGLAGLLGLSMIQRIKAKDLSDTKRTQ